MSTDGGKRRYRGATITARAATQVITAIQGLDNSHGGSAILRLGGTEERSDDRRREVGEWSRRVEGIPANDDEQ